MLGLVPLASAWRQVAHGDGKAELIDQLCSSTFHNLTRAPCCRRHQRRSEVARVGIALTSPELPPASNGVDRKACGVVVDAHADPSVLSEMSYTP